MSKIRISLLLMVFSCSTILTSAQIVPAQNRVDWSQAGIQDPIPVSLQQVNVVNFGAIGNGIADDRSAIVNAIASLNGQMGTVFFPAGTYLIGATISLPGNVILKGVSSESTFIRFDLGGTATNGFSIFGNPTSSFVPVLSGLQKGSNTIHISDPTGISSGDYLEIEQDNGTWDVNPAIWAATSVGQIVKVTAVNGNQLSIDQEIRLDYDTILNPVARLVAMKQFVGIECMHIERLDDAAIGAGYNMQFHLATNCWVSGVESAKSVGSHVMISTSTHVEVTGSYFHHAFAYNGSATKGYGITMAQHTGLSLVENNIFRFLRHAMMVKEGANGNVFAYNYSREPNRSEFISDFSGDISCHGHYPFGNLFEGNIVQNIIIDHFWGESGPNNTFLRNRAERYGIIVTSAAPQTMAQNFIGNEVAGLGVYLTGNNSHIEFGNNVLDSILPVGTDSVLPNSYYGSMPAFWNTTDPWPSIGLPYALNAFSNPAKDRYFSGSGLTACCSAATLCDLECITPGNLQVQYTGNNAVQLQWQPPMNGNGFEIRGKVAGAASWVTIPLSCGTCNSFQVNNLNPSLTYVWQIRSDCDTSISHWSVLNSFSIMDFTSCSMTQLKAVSNITATEATISWTREENALAYEIYGRQAGSSAIVKLIVSAPDTFFHVSNLTPATNYEYAIRAICHPTGIVKSAFTSIDNFTTLPVAIVFSEKGIAVPKVHLKIFPNPSHGKFTLELVDATITGTYTFEVMDVTGQKVLTAEYIGPGVRSIDMTGSQPGIYYLKIHGEEQYQGKIIVL